MKAMLVSPVEGEEFPLVCPVADSAIARDNMPLFLPQFTDKWVGCVCLAFRIVRLGKGIARRFAYRYIDGVSALYLLRVREDDGTTEAFIRSGARFVMDGTLTYGKWLPFSPDCPEYRIEVGDRSVTTSLEHTEIDALISGFSRIATVKSGDLFVLPHVSLPAEPVLGTRIEASLNGEKCLSLKIR